jgi:type I restriction enzyme S subunit
MRPYLRVANVHEARIDISNVLEMNFEPEEAERFLLLAGDVLLNEGQSYELVGRPAVYRGEVPGACFQNTLIRFRPRKHVVLSEFALVVFRAYMRTGRLRQEAQQTTNIAHLSAGRLAVIEFPLPPLEEQKRIVARVDQLLALIDDLEARQTKKREVSARFTKAALEALASAEGPEEFDAAWNRVANHWGDAFGTADRVQDLRELCLWLGLSGRLDVSASEAGNWLDTTLGDLAEFITSGSRGWKEFYSQAGAIFVRSQDIKTDALDLTSPAFVALPARVEGSRTRVQKDDLLVTITGANVGKAAHVADELSEAYVSQHVALIRLRDPRNAPWIHKWLVSSRNGRKTLTGFSYGDKPGLNLDNVKSVPIRLPPVIQQQRIVAKIGDLMKLCDNLEAKLSRAEDRATKLVAAVVHKMMA